MLLILCSVSFTLYHVGRKNFPLPLFAQFWRHCVNSTSHFVLFLELRFKNNSFQVVGIEPTTITLTVRQPNIFILFILAHPNVKIFITHGGLLSTMESLQFGIPLIAIPVFGDQPSNARRSEKAEHALVVKLSPKMDIDLKEKLNTMLNNDR